MIRLLAFQAQREKIPCSGNSCARKMAHLLLAGYEYVPSFLKLKLLHSAMQKSEIELMEFRLLSV
jgi:hypothetical protein